MQRPTHLSVKSSKTAFKKPFYKEKRIIPQKQKPECPNPISYKPDYYKYFYYGDTFFRQGNIQQANINWCIAKGIAENAFKLPNGKDNIEDAKFDYGFICFWIVDKLYNSNNYIPEPETLLNHAYLYLKNTIIGSKIEELRTKIATNSLYFRLSNPN